MSETTQKTERRVRAVILGEDRRKALVLFNNRVIPGRVCVMLPGGGIEAGETPIQALARELFEEIGVREDLNRDNCRFLLSRSYEFPEHGAKKFVELGFFVVEIPHLVPRNMEPEKVISVEWCSLADLDRWTLAKDHNYQVQLGAMDALRAALDPVRAGLLPSGGREVARQDAPRDPRPARPRLPAGAPAA